MKSSNLTGILPDINPYDEGLNNLNSSVLNLQNGVKGIDTLWVMISSALLLLMFPGLGFYYSGYVKRSCSLSIFMSVFFPLALVMIQWYFVGFSLVFSDTGCSMIGNFRFSLLQNVGLESNPIATTIPSSVFMIFQGFFAAITPCLIFGAIIERASLTSFIIICLVWTTFVYDFIAYWTWNKNGWLYNLGTLDFAGGGPVHMASGFSALAYSLVIGSRKNANFRSTKPIHLTEIILGTGLLWFGWLGFNAGSELALNARAVNAFVNTIFAPCSGGITWVCIEMLVNRSTKISINAFCTGVVASLVSITPACGFVQPGFGILIGFITSLFCYSGTYVKTLLKIEDTTDVFAVHGLGGLIGSICTGIFAQNSVVALSLGDSAIPGGFLDTHYIQLFHQIIGAVCTTIWAFLLTALMTGLLHFVPFIKLRIDDEEERGADQLELGESVYGVELDGKINMNPNNLRNPSKSRLSGVVGPLGPLDIKDEVGFKKETFNDIKMNDLQNV